MLDLNQSKSNLPKSTTQSSTASMAAGDLYSEMGDGPFAAVFFFTSGDYDLAALGATLSTYYPDTPIYGSTSAGIIGKDGYGQNGVSAFGLPKDHFYVDAEILPNIQSMDMSSWGDYAKSLISRMEGQVGPLTMDNTFGLVLVDGLSLAEEVVLSAIYPQLGGIPLFGGSAGDDLKFEQTKIFCNNHAFGDSAALILIHTDCPFHVFRTEHFVETQKKMVITEADPASRLVKEINAAPATEEYARLIGVQQNQLNSTVFAANPLMVRVGGSYYVRSIQKPEEQDGLRFYCAIDEGLVLTLAKGQDMVANLRSTFETVSEKVGRPELIIGCDCIFRRLELEQTPEKFQEVSKTLQEYNVYGFNTYGEQFAGMHVNQTFTGVAIGWRDGDD